MSDAPPRAAARLLKAATRFRRRSRAARELGLPMPFRRWRKAALVRRLQREWTGGYGLSAAGDLVFLPPPLEFQGLRLLFGGSTAHPAALAFLPPGGVALDVGANLGEWTLPLAKAAGPAGAVVAVEPNPPIAAALALTLRINNLPQARVAAVALSDRAGDGTLLPDAANSGATRLGSGGAAEGGVAVPLTTLDLLVEAQGLARLDLVKLDVEGHERRVLAGATASLTRLRPALVMESAHEGKGERPAIADLLARLGYDLVAVLFYGGALAATLDDYRFGRGACAGAEAHDLLLLPQAR